MKCTVFFRLLHKIITGNILETTYITMIYATTRQDYAKSTPQNHNHIFIDIKLIKINYLKGKLHQRNKDAP